jgi:hypothetical protein
VIPFTVIASEIPCSDTQGIGSEIQIASALFEIFGAASGYISQNFLYFSLLSGNLGRRPVRARLPHQPILSHKIKRIEVAARRAGAIFMLHRVAKISTCFQGPPVFVGDSTQHERNMDVMRDHTLDMQATP